MKQGGLVPMAMSSQLPTSHHPLCAHASAGPSPAGTHLNPPGTGKRGAWTRRRGSPLACPSHSSGPQLPHSAQGSGVTDLSPWPGPQERVGPSRPVHRALDNSDTGPAGPQLTIGWRPRCALGPVLDTGTQGRHRPCPLTLARLTVTLLAAEIPPAPSHLPLPKSSPEQ